MTLNDLDGAIGPLAREAREEWAISRAKAPAVVLRVNGVEQALFQVIVEQDGRVVLEAR